MSALSDALKNPNGTRVFLAEVTVAKRYTFFEDYDVDTYSTPDTDIPVDIKVNGTSLTLVADAATVVATPNSWFNDGDTTFLNTALVVRNWNDVVVQAVVQFRFSTPEPKVFEDKPYDPRIKALPNLQMRVEREFDGIGQTGGGDLTLGNEDAALSRTQDWDWDAGTTKIKMGYDTAYAKMDFADYENMATFLNSGFTLTETEFSIQLQELKARIKKDVPFDFYTTDDYPNLMENDFNKPRQLAYGTIYSAAPVCIDTTTRRFKVADHAIKSFLDVRVSTSNGWVTSAFASQDLALGEFTLGPDWDGESSPSVDFQGKTNTDGTLMDNAADIVRDLLENYIGETDLNTASFDAAYELLDYGNIFNSVHRKTVMKPSVYVIEQQDAYQLINIVNSFVGAFLYVDANGQYNYKVFFPESRKDLPTFGDDDGLQDFSLVNAPNNKLSKLNTSYARRESEDWGQGFTVEKKSNQYRHGQPTPVSDAEEVPTVDFEDADYQARRKLIFDGEPLVNHKFSLKNALGFLLRPGDKVHVQYKAKNDGSQTYTLDAVLDITSITYNLSETKVELETTNQRGWADSSGFWVSDVETLPSFLSGLTGYGSGSIVWNKNWHRQIKDYARQSYGYWTTDEGYADATDPESFMPSRWV